MGSENNHDSLTAAYIGDTVIIRVEGRGSFKTSPPMKQFIQKVIDNRAVRHILIDMADCCAMDSTFMGVIAGLACHIKSIQEITFKLINLSEKNQKQFITLGVDRVVDYSLSSSADEQSLINQQNSDTQTLEPNFADKLEAAKTSLDAHATLVDINPENLAKFKSVLEFLQDDVRNLSGK